VLVDTDVVMLLLTVLEMDADTLPDTVADAVPIPRNLKPAVTLAEAEAAH
jgi:hypothetical protein